MVTTIHLGGRVPRFGDKQRRDSGMTMSKPAMPELISIFICNSIFKRFPNLKLASVGSVAGWMGWLPEYNGRTWKKHHVGIRQSAFGNYLAAFA